MTTRLENPLFELLRADAHISVNKALLFALGNDEALIYAELLSRYAYFADREGLTEDGCFYNTAEDLESATNLSGYKQRIAIKKLSAMKLVSVSVKGIPPKRHFRIENRPDLLAQYIHMGKEKARKTTDNHNCQKISPFKLKKLHTNKKKNKGNGKIGICPDCQVEITTGSQSYHACFNTQAATQP